MCQPINCSKYWWNANTRKKPNGCGSSCIVMRLHDSAHLALKFNGSTSKLHFGLESNPSISLSQYNISTHRMFRYVVMNLNTAHIQVCRKKQAHIQNTCTDIWRERELRTQTLEVHRVRTNGGASLLGPATERYT